MMAHTTKTTLPRPRGRQQPQIPAVYVTCDFETLKPEAFTLTTEEFLRWLEDTLRRLQPVTWALLNALERWPDAPQAARTVTLNLSEIVHGVRELVAKQRRAPLR